jgi:hypothetical protein
VRDGAKLGILDGPDDGKMLGSLDGSIENIFEG